MQNVEVTTLPKKYHEAVERWRDTYLPDYRLLIDNWEKFFPRDPEFKLCAYRQCGMCGTIECGENEGKDKYQRAEEMSEAQAGALLKAVTAQASTEFGSIQQHQLTLSRAQDEQDQFWILRMMAEELRHGYQMFSVLLSDDWKKVSKHTGEEIVEEVLSMRTGSHVLGAFNVDFDSFVDSIVFCALIDRVGKYQLSMQKISAYAPMAQSMPPMLVEEAFHLAAGVVPLRRWVKTAATTDATITMDLIQRTINKWFPRGLDMFGDERGGGTNVKYGFKPMKNAEAIEQYADEVRVLVRDLNIRFVRARAKDCSREEAERIVDNRESAHGIDPAELLDIPSVKFFRRRGIHAYQPYDVNGNKTKNWHDLKRHLEAVMPGTYPAGRDFSGYLDLMQKIENGELTPEQAVPLLPNLSRVGGVCPCSKAVRWVLDGNGNGA
jgi:1,2-phenylacetyl-CoA epoxidase catalytic subunit